MADTKRPSDAPGQGAIESLDESARTWVEKMLPLVGGAQKPGDASPLPNKPNDLQFTDISRYPQQFALPGPAPPADVDPLTTAIKAKDAYKVQQYVGLLIVSGYHLGGPDSNGDIPLIVAAKANDYIITTMVVGPHPNPRNSGGETPLIIAVQLGNVQTVEFLLKKKADLWPEDKKQKNALAYALENRTAAPSNKDYAKIVTLLEDAVKVKEKAKTAPKAGEKAKPKAKPKP